jgi:hypothetical protein
LGFDGGSRLASARAPQTDPREIRVAIRRFAVEVGGALEADDGTVSRRGVA